MISNSLETKIFRSCECYKFLKTIANHQKQSIDFMPIGWVRLQLAAATHLSSIAIFRGSLTVAKSCILYLKSYLKSEIKMVRIVTSVNVINSASNCVKDRENDIR